jgi:hypothetical protein
MHSISKKSMELDIKLFLLPGYSGGMGSNELSPGEADLRRKLET